MSTPLLINVGTLHHAGMTVAVAVSGLMASVKLLLCL